MPTTQELPHPPLEGDGFVQKETGMDTVVPQGRSMAAAEQKGNEGGILRGRGKRKTSPDTELG